MLRMWCVIVLHYELCSKMQQWVRRIAGYVCIQSLKGPDTVISAHMLFYCDRWLYRWHIWCVFFVLFYNIRFSQNPCACMNKIPHDCGQSNVPHLQSNENVGQRLTVSVMAVHRQCADGHLCQHIAQHLGHGARSAYANGVPQGYFITAQLKQPLCHLGRNRGKPWKHYPLWKYKQDEGVHTESSFWALEKHCRVSASCWFFSKHRNKGLVGLWKLWEKKNMQRTQHPVRFITYWKAHLI